MTQAPKLLVLNQMAGPMTWELVEDFAARIGPLALLTGHPDTLRHWRSTGSVDLPFVRVGGSVRYSESEVLDYLKQKRGEE